MTPLELSVPGDKSIAHRAVLLGMLAEGDSLVRGVPASADVESSIRAALAFGVRVESEGDVLRIGGRGIGALRAPSAPIDCGNSGTTARLCMGVAAALEGETILDGDASLRMRPMERVAEPLRRAGGRVEAVNANGHLPVVVRGTPLGPIRHEDGIASAQVKSALLLAAICAGVPACVRAPASRDHTERMLRAMGLNVVERGVAESDTGVGAGTADGERVEISIEPPYRLRPLELSVPGDASSAAFLIAASLLTGAPVVIRDVGVNPGRTGFLDIVRRMGARVQVLGRSERGGEPVADLRVEPGPLARTEVAGAEVARAIDELPLVAILAAHARGVTSVRGARELRAKETDRIAAICANLHALGVEADEARDGFVVRGADAALSGSVRSFGDHRIAMAFAVLGLRPGSHVDVDDLDVARVSFPGFAERIEQMRGVAARSGGSR